MPLTPTFQSAFQSAYRSGFTHNAGVFNSKRLDLSTNHDSSDTTISDRSPYGNDATLKSGVYFSTNGLTDKGINADCSAAGSGTYKLTGKVRSASTGTKHVTMDGATGDTLTINTADVWEDFESSTFTGTPSNVVMGWDGGSNFSACDWSDIRLIDTSDGSTVAHLQGNDSGASDLDGKLVADSSGNGYHGAHIGCAGGSAEGMDPVLAGLPGELLWFDGVDDSVSANIGTFYSSNDTIKIEVEVGAVFCDLDVMLTLGANDSNGFKLVGRTSPFEELRGELVVAGTFYTRGSIPIIQGTYTIDIDKTTPSFTITDPNGGQYTNNASAQVFALKANGNLHIGFRPTLNDKYFEGTLSNIKLYDNSATLVHFLKGNGNTNAAWADQAGSSDGTVNGSPITLATKRQTILQTAGGDFNRGGVIVEHYNIADDDGAVLNTNGTSSVSVNGENWDLEIDYTQGLAIYGNFSQQLSGTPIVVKIIVDSISLGGASDIRVRLVDISAAVADTINISAAGTYYLISSNGIRGDGLRINATAGTSNATLTVSEYTQYEGYSPQCLIPASDSNPAQDAIGNPIDNPRPNNKVINLIADDAKATVAADASMDVTKTIEGWVYYDGTDQTFLDIGTPIINSSSDVLGSTLAGTLTYYVNGVATTALGSAGWKHIAITSDTVQATDAIDILATSAAWKMIDRTLTATEVLSRFNSSRFQYSANWEFHYLRPDGSAILRPDSSQYIRP